MAEEFRPQEVKILIIGESPPEGGAYLYDKEDIVRMFASNIISAINGEGEFPHDRIKQKSLEYWLKYLQEQGVWIIDAVKLPINKMKSDKRKAAISEATPMVLNEIKDIKWDPNVKPCIAICHSNLGDLYNQCKKIFTDQKVIFPKFPQHYNDKKWIQDVWGCWHKINGPLLH